MSEYTIGVEEEYQLISAKTGELVSRADEVLETDWSGEIHPESQQTMLEVGTRICTDAQELSRELRRLRLQVASTAAAEGLSSVAAGVHPFSCWENQIQSSGERYENIVERYGRVTRSDQIFGMHTHVAVPARIDRIRVMNRVREYIPHLLALSASSPIYEGEDTGYASYRTVLAERYPHAGPPPRFDSEESYRSFVDLLLRAGAIPEEGALYWSIRPHAEYPTLEFRMTDVCPRVDDAVSIAALIRVLVVAAAEKELSAAAQLGSEPAADELLTSNVWQAARYGLEGVLVEPRAEAARQPLRSAISQLLDTLRPVADSLGESSMLSGVGRILERGNGADRIREQLSTREKLPDLARWLSRETLLGVGMDRRTAQRDEVA